MAQKHIEISEREITYLARKFVVYLAVAHRQSREKIKRLMQSRGGYILHLDATCEGGSPHLLSGVDGLTEIVLENVIIPFLQNIK